MRLFTKVKKWFIRSKEWMESFASKPSSMFYLFLFAFADASFFPTADILLFAILLTAPKRGLTAALYSTLGSVSGGIFGYYIGYSFMDLAGWRIVDFYNAQSFWEQVVNLYHQKYGDWFLAIASFTPVPFKIATISAGAVKMPILNFIIITLIGRAARYYLFGGLMYYLGPKVKPFLDKYFLPISIFIIIVVIFGFFAIEYLFK